MSRHIVSVFAAAAFTLGFVTCAQADQESDKLREALRIATTQARAAEDQKVALQAKITSLEQERDRLRKQTEALRGQVKDAEQAYRQAVKDFNDGIGQRDEALEKWKDAYGEAAVVARTKDAERAKFEAEAAALKAVAKSCESKNDQLVKIAEDVVRGFEEMNPADKVLNHEPLLGFLRVQTQNKAQDFRGRIVEQGAKP